MRVLSNVWPGLAWLVRSAAWLLLGEGGRTASCCVCVCVYRVYIVKTDCAELNIEHLARRDAIDHTLTQP